MTSKSAVNEFIAQKKLAVVGVSRSGSKFGNMAFKALKGNGYELFPIHPVAETLEGVNAYPNLKSVPEPLGGLLIIVPPAQTERIVQEAKSAGIELLVTLNSTIKQSQPLFKIHAETKGQLDYALDFFHQGHDIFQIEENI